MTIEHWLMAWPLWLILLALFGVVAWSGRQPWFTLHPDRQEKGKA